MKIHHKTYLLFLIFHVAFNQSALCTSKSLGVVVTYISEWNYWAIYCISYSCLVKRFQGKFPSYWYILQWLWIRFPDSILTYWYILSYASRYLCGLPSYMVSSSRKTSNVVMSFQISNTILEVRIPDHMSDLTQVIFGTCWGIQIVHWLECVIIPLLIIGLNIYSILGPKNRFINLAYCRRLTGFRKQPI